VKTWADYTKPVAGQSADGVVTGLVEDASEDDREIANAIQSAIGVKINDATVGEVEEDHFDNTFDSPAENAVTNHFGTLMEENPYIPVEAMNYSVADFTTADEETHNFLEKFVPPTAPEKYDMHSQGHRHCEGKKQRQGKSKELRCHLIDLDELNAMDVVTLKRFVTDDGEIMGKRITGLCAKCQRAVARTVKNSRNMGMMPHLGQFVLRDGKPQFKPTAYHDPAVVDINDTIKGETKMRLPRVHSKTIVP
jgi:small subunit ribosomal protein S18